MSGPAKTAKTTVDEDQLATLLCTTAPKHELQKAHPHARLGSREEIQNAALPRKLHWRLCTQELIPKPRGPKYPIFKDSGPKGHEG